MARREMHRLAAGAPAASCSSSTSGCRRRAAAASAAASTSCARPPGCRVPPPVLLMSETIDEKLRGRARRLGVSLLTFKPGLSKLDPAAVRGGPARLRRQARARPAAAPRGAPREVRRGPRRRAAADAGRRARRPSRPRSRRSRRCPTRTSSPSCCCGRRVPRSPASSCSSLKDDRLRGLSGFGPLDGRAASTCSRASCRCRSTSPPRSATPSPRAAPGRGPIPADGPDERPGRSNRRGFGPRGRDRAAARLAPDDRGRVRRRPRRMRRCQRSRPSPASSSAPAARSRARSPDAGQPQHPPDKIPAPRTMTLLRGARSLLSVLLVGLYFVLGSPVLRLAGAARAPGCSRASASAW